MKKEIICKICGGHHYKTFCSKTPKKPIKKTSIKKTIKPKKPSRSKIKKELDKLVKDYVKERDGHICQHCGKKVSGKSCQGSHVFSVGSCSVLQFEPLNIKTLCGHCHLWWHSTPIESGQWFEQKFPERLAQLNVLKQSKTKTSTVELQMMIEEYKDKLKNIS
jgi:5-methylcytosine-specific restriction endonuclease McrA